MRKTVMTTGLALVALFTAFSPTATALPEVPDISGSCPDSMTLAQRVFDDPLGQTFHEFGWTDPDTSCVFDYAVGVYSHEDTEGYHYYVTAFNDPPLCCL